jgi:hypothetical protein
VACPSCGASFAHDADRQVLGLAPVHLLPGEASPESIASALSQTGGSPSPARVSPSSAVGEPAAEPDAVAVLSAARRRIGRQQVVIALLVVGVLALGAVVAAMLAGWRPLADRFGRAPGALAPTGDTGGTVPVRPAEASLPEAEAKPAPEQPAEPPPPEPSPVEEPPAPPSEDPPEGSAEPPAPAPVESRRALRDRVLAMLAADPPDTPGAIAACDAMAAADPAFDAAPWRRLIDDRVRAGALRALP